MREKSLAGENKSSHEQYPLSSTEKICDEMCRRARACLSGCVRANREGFSARVYLRTIVGCLCPCTFPQSLCPRCVVFYLSIVF